MKCGKKGCKCQGTPPELHGPYYQWSAKVNGITKTVRLKSSEVDAYKGWVKEGKHLDELIAQWKKISLAVARREI
jgi:hypothetical protein